MGLFDGAGGGGLFGRRPAVAPGTVDPNAAYQMPRLPWAQNDFVTLAALGMIGAPNIDQAMQNVAQIAPAGLASNTAKRRDMYSLQEKARTDAKSAAEQAGQRAALNAIIKIKSNMPVTPAEQAAIDAFPELKIKYGMPAERDPVIPEGSLVWDEKTQTYKPAAGAEGPDPDIINPTSAMRKEYESQPGTSSFRITNPILRSMTQSLSSTRAPSDLDFIYGIAKIYDPPSAVREGEFDLVRATQSMPDDVKGVISKALSGEQSLSTQTRRDLVSAARTRVEQYRRQAEQEGQYYSETATRQRLDARNIVRPLDALPDLPALPDVPAPPDPNL